MGPKTEAAIGASNAPRRPPRCRTTRFRSIDVDLFAKLRRPDLYVRNLVFWAGVNGTFPFNTFLAHSHRQAISPGPLPLIIALLMSVGALARWRNVAW